MQGPETTKSIDLRVFGGEASWPAGFVGLIGYRGVDIWVSASFGARGADGRIRQRVAKHVYFYAVETQQLGETGTLCLNCLPSWDGD